jgi:hypothetical protein
VLSSLPGHALQPDATATARFEDDRLELRTATGAVAAILTDGGTVELLAWLVAMGAAGRRAAQTDFYVPSVALRCGMGGVSWNAA